MKIKFSCRSYISFILLISICSFTHCLNINTSVKCIMPNALPLDSKNYKVMAPSKIKASSFHLLWFIPVTPGIDQDEAIKNAIIKAGGDNLIDVRIWEERQIWIVGRVNILHIEGMAVQYTD